MNSITEASIVSFVRQLKVYSFKVVSIGASFFNFPVNEESPELAKILWIVKLRWLAIVLFFTLAIPGLVFGILSRETFPQFIALIGVLFIFNLLMQLRFSEKMLWIGRPQVYLQLVFDLFILAGLIFIAGGVENPFTVLFLLNVSLGALLITGSLSWIFLLLAHTTLLALQVIEVAQRGNSMTMPLITTMVAYQGMLFAFWIVMRSLGFYLERQQSKQAQIKINAEKQDRLRAVGALAAGFSHEFSSPLNTIKIRLERIQRLSPSEDITEALSAVDACEEVIQQMNSSQLDPRSFHAKSIVLSDLVQDVLDSWQEEHPNATIQTEIKNIGPVQIPPINFAQAFLNILDNAFEAAPDKQIIVKLSEFQQGYSLRIEDNGPGIPGSILSKIGEPFITTKKNGTGLGLYVTQLFSQSLGGDLRIDNMEGGGAAVSLVWPKHEVIRG